MNTTDGNAATGVDPRVITVLREPAARVRSLFTYIHREPDHPRHAEFSRDAVTIADVYDRVRMEPFDNHQVRYLAGPDAHAKPFGALTETDLELAKRNLETGCTAFGLQERFAESLAWFGETLGWPGVEAGRLNTSPGSASGFSESERRLVLGHNALDLELYDFAQRLFAERTGVH